MNAICFSLKEKIKHLEDKEILLSLYENRKLSLEKWIEKFEERLLETEVVALLGLTITCKVICDLFNY